MNMDMVANLDLSPKSVRKSVEAGTIGNRLFHANGATELSFRERFETVVNNVPPTSPNVNQIDSNRSSEREVQEGQPNESITQFLFEIETFTKEELDLSDYEDVLTTLPNDLADQVKAFISSIQSGSEKLEVNQVNEKAELMAILLLATGYIEDDSFTNKERLLDLLKQLKVTANEIIRPTLLDGKEVEDVRTNKLIHELFQKVEDKLPLADKSLTEGQSRFQYLQTVHARYFSAPKGIEKLQTAITDKLLQKASNTSLDIGTSNEKILISDVGTNQISKVQQFSIYVEQTGKQSPNQHLFIRQFQNIIARSSFMNNGGQQKLLIHLYPEHLGSLRIELLQSEAGIIARIMASTSHAKEIVESHLNNLKHTFLTQNILVEKIEVSTQLHYQTERSLQRESDHQQGQQSGRQQKDSNQQEPNEEQSFSSALLDELVNFKV